MAAASLILGLVGCVFMIGGMLGTMVPYVGSILSFGAPVLCLFGLILGGVAMSRANRMDEPSGLATAGMVINGVGFLFSLLLALTCGLCNACISTAAMNPQNQGQWSPQGPGTTPFGGTPFGATPTAPFGATPTAPFGATPTAPFGATPTAPFGATPTAPFGATPAPFGATPGSSDERCVAAEQCCLAFADGDATFCESSVASARTSSEPSTACARLAEGWTTGLRAMGHDVPDSCNQAQVSSVPNTVCTNNCAFARDGNCDDGRPGAGTQHCPIGSDCDDCGIIELPSPTPTGNCSDTCAHSSDGECDDGRPGAHTNACASGTDCSDCGPA